jgi:hypothetical protein
MGGILAAPMLYLLVGEKETRYDQGIRRHGARLKIEPARV